MNEFDNHFHSTAMGISRSIEIAGKLLRGDAQSFLGFSEKLLQYRGGVSILAKYSHPHTGVPHLSEVPLFDAASISPDCEYLYPRRTLP